MGRWVYFVLVTGALVACSSDGPGPSPGGGGEAGDTGEDGGEGNAAQAGSGTNSGGAGSNEGGTAPNAGKSPVGDAGQHAGGDAGAGATCDEALCENDGVCPADGGASCECTGGFTGPHCELPIFELLELPVDATSMSAIGVSADGSVVIGNVGFPTHSSGYRWTRETGAVLLDSLPTHDGTQATQVSADSRIIVGSSSLAGVSTEPAKWSVGVESPQELMTNAWKTLTASHVNADGTVVAGFGTLADDSISAFRWTEATGPVAIGPSSETEMASVVAISADGATIVANLGGTSAFVWTETNGAENLPPLAGDDGTFVQGMSADATTMIGNSLSSTISSKRVVWRDGGAPVQLDPEDPGTGWTCGGGPIQTCTTVSADGSVIYTQRNSIPVRYTAAGGLETFVNFEGKFACLVVGPTVGPAGKVAGTCFGPPLAVLWDADGGTVTKLADVLTDAGADASALAGASTSMVRAVSANGDTIVGDNFFGGGAWVARPPQ